MCGGRCLWKLDLLSSKYFYKQEKNKEIIKAQEKGTCASLRHVSRNLLMGALVMLVSKLVTSRQAVSRHMMLSTDSLHV